jgi:peptidyl-tRNA hydrolase
VLSAFNAAEEKAMEGLLEKGMAACRTWAAEPLTKAMSQINAGSL